MDAIELAHRFELNVYPKRDVVFVRGKGAKLWDDAGREYVDCAAGVGVANLGHGNEAVLKAVSVRQKTTRLARPAFTEDIVLRVVAAE